MNLPISKVLDKISNEIQKHHLVIVSTPTSSGKTMCIPLLCAEKSEVQTFCTVPRRILASEAAKSANTIHEANVSGFIHGEDEADKTSKVIYITEGSFIMRKLGEKYNPGEIICLDEVHEQGKLMDALLFCAIEWCQRGKKVILMSATLEIPKYKGYFEKRGLSVGVVELPQSETSFQTDFVITEDPIKAVADAANAGGRVIVGLPGVKEIEDFSKGISRTFKGKIFQLHGEVELDEQEQALKYDASCVYLCTNMVQSGITIKNLTHGYFEGHGKRIELSKGESKLVKYKLSKSEMRQWFGRLGRMCKGTIFVTSEKEISLEGRDEMPTPENLRTSLEDIILQFAYMGYRFNDCKLLNKPSKANIDFSFEILKKLGCVDDSFEVNDYGLDIISEGSGVRGGIIIHEGRKIGMENTARKIAVVSQYRSFLSKSSEGNTPVSKVKRWLSKDYEIVKHSDQLILVKIAEYFIQKYCKVNESKTGYVVDEMQEELFKKECEDSAVFRRTLLNIIYQFYRIDEKYSDEEQNFFGITQAIGKMYADKIVVASHGRCFDGTFTREVGKTSKALQTFQSTAVGEFASIEAKKGKTLYLIEMITYL